MLPSARPPRHSGTVSQPTARTPNTRLIIALCAAIFALGQFHRAAGSVFTPILIDRFALSATVISGLVSAMFLAAVLTQIPLGAALDRYGPRRMLCLSILVAALGTGLFAIGDSYEALFAARLTIGLGTAVCGAATHVIVARTFPERQFGYANGMIIMFGSTGGLMGTYPLALALGRFDWTLVFGTVMVFVLLLLAAIYRIVPPGPVPKPAQTEGQPTGYLSLLRSAEVRKILTIGLVTFAPITTITGIWGGPFLQDVLGMSPEASGAVLLMLFGASVLSAFLFGQLDRLVTRRKVMILIAAGLSSACLFTLALLPGPGPVVTIALLFGMMFCQQFYIPLGAHMRKVVPLGVVGRASIMLSLVGVAAIPVMQTGFGVILDFARAEGFDAAQQFRFSFGAMGLVIALCASVYALARDADAEVR
ncbi:MAG: MFS transporter [Pseudomonadota bacterium]